jgi:hypothetical protein
LPLVLALAVIGPSRVTLKLNRTGREDLTLLIVGRFQRLDSRTVVGAALYSPANTAANTLLKLVQALSDPH